MKSFARVALFSLICSTLPFSHVYSEDDIDSDISSEETIAEDESPAAVNDFSNIEKTSIDDEEETLTLEEANALIELLPTSSDAVTGTVKEEYDYEYYDIYGRTLGFRESAKKLRESLEARRESFEKPRIEIIDLYRDSKEKIDKAQTAAYNESLKEEEDEENLTENEILIDEDEVVEENNEDAVSKESDISLTEKTIPSKEGDDENAPKRKVVISEDAPDFDPSKL